MTAGHLEDPDPDGRPHGPATEGTATGPSPLDSPPRGPSVPAGDEGAAVSSPYPRSSAERAPAPPAPRERVDGGGDGQGPPGGAGAGRPGPRPGRKGKGVLSFFRELPVLLVIAFLLALLIKTFLVQAFFIPSESMFPTLDVGDRVLVNKVVYRLHPPRRGDIIVFEEPNSLPQPHRGPVIAFLRWLTQGLGVTANPEKDFIKRVVGLPGETIEIQDCVVYVDGRPLDEPYVNPENTGSCRYGPHRVEPDSLFVMGDNRGNSRDSRFGLGDVPMDKVVGRAFVVIWPPSRIGWLREP